MRKRKDSWGWKTYPVVKLPAKKRIHLEASICRALRWGPPGETWAATEGRIPRGGVRSVSQQPPSPHQTPSLKRS